MAVVPGLVAAGLLLSPQVRSAGEGRTPAGSSSVKKPAASPEAQLTLFNVLLAAKDYGGAERVVKDGLANFPAAHGFHLALGDLHAARGESADAFYEYQWELLRAGGDRPTGASAARRGAELLKKAAGSDREELRAVVAAIKGTPRDPKGSFKVLSAVESKRGKRFVLRLFIAEAAQVAGRTEEAREIYRALIERDPHFVPAYLQLGELLDKSGKTDEAMKLLARARSVDPDHWHFKQ